MLAQKATMEAGSARKKTMFAMRFRASGESEEPESVEILHTKLAKICQAPEIYFSFCVFAANSIFIIVLAACFLFYCCTP